MGAGELLPGSPEAEAVADALLVCARGCGRRLAQVLIRAGREAGTKGEGLRRAGEEILLSCAYHTEAELRRRPRRNGRYLVPVPLSDLLTDRQPLCTDVAWIDHLTREGLPGLAERLGLAGRQAEVWVAYVCGFTPTEIA
ncbi:MAG: hypothetical protein QHJ73_16470, partial [Armatimonadota bacterium]|nr:hypothetical protein [Armatimonadota bacterium]